MDFQSKSRLVFPELGNEYSFFVKSSLTAGGLNALMLLTATLLSSRYTVLAKASPPSPSSGMHNVSCHQYHPYFCPVSQLSAKVRIAEVASHKRQIPTCVSELLIGARIEQEISSEKKFGYKYHDFLVPLSSVNAGHPAGPWS